ncbi:DUF1214 domain-containing protein [Sphingobium estronivorans]|uniref:DUF1214 domain-containing protein n=1 Tax=Sphingobium estronivorans TaxID=1577690 RepID=UPI0013C31876|nr:DUF1214 domain-containing protein [Sphingobium estronivorans]
MRKYLGALAALASTAAWGGEAIAQGAGAEQATTPGWNEFVEQLRALPAMILAKLPEDQRRDPRIQQEVGRLALEALAARSLEAISADVDNPVFLPSLNQTLNVYQPNSDTIYKETPVDPTASYRLRGTRGSLRIFKLGQLSRTGPDGKEKVVPLAYGDFNALPVDAQGKFDVLISPTKPQDYQGSWWKLEPQANSFVIRQVSADWGKERDPTLSIERLDRSTLRPRESVASLRKRLDALGRQTANTALFLVGIPGELRKEGFVNKLKIFDVTSNMGGLFGQFYYHGVYELNDDEALILEAKVPSKCGYYSTILTNDLFETTDWVNNQSSLNDTQSRIDSDGMLRIVISARDPGVPNWLDTAGYPTGVVQGRWTDCNAQPMPSLTKVRLSDLSRYLPKDTPHISAPERDRQLRSRRANFLQRILW